jgi:hypothetical protein
MGCAGLLVELAPELLPVAGVAGSLRLKPEDGVVSLRGLTVIVVGRLAGVPPLEPVEPLAPNPPAPSADPPAGVPPVVGVATRAGSDVRAAKSGVR